jgi:hypothetical protein
MKFLFLFLFYFQVNGGLKILMYGQIMDIIS